MAATSLSLHKSPHLYRFLEFSRKPISHTGQQICNPANPAQASAFRGCYCSSNSYTSNFGHGTIFKNMGSSNVGFGPLGFDRLHVSAVADGGSDGGTGGGFGGSGDGNSGGRSEGGSSGINWSSLHWCLALLSKYLAATKPQIAALLTLTGDLICQIPIEQLSPLDLIGTFLFTSLGLVLTSLWAIMVALDEFVVIFCIGIVFVCIFFFAIFCCIGIVALDYTVATRQGESEDDITSLHPENSECCICLSQYVDGEELHALPCNHRFHSGCISNWLWINATCPLCRYNIRSGDTLV